MRRDIALKDLQRKRTGKERPNVFIVKAESAVIDEIQKSNKVAIEPMFLDYYRLIFKRRGSVESQIAFLEAYDLKSIEQEILVSQLATTPNDTYASQILNYNLVQGIDGIWDTINANPSLYVPQKIAVIDVAYDTLHEDLTDNLLPGYNPVMGHSNVDFRPETDLYGNHGTSTASIICANTNNAKGVFGLAYKCKVFPIAVIGLPDLNYSAHYATAVAWSLNTGCRVVSNSWGYAVDYNYMRDACKLLYDNGVIMVAGSGNDGTPPDAVLYPGRYDTVIGVSATENVSGVQNNIIHSRAIYGNGVTFCTAWNTYACRVNNTYATFSGTSCATPQVAALVGMLLSINPHYTQQEIISLIASKCTREAYSNTDPRRDNGLFGYGIPHFTNTLQAAFDQVENNLVPAKQLNVNGSWICAVYHCLPDRSYRKYWVPHQ